MPFRAIAIMLAALCGGPALAQVPDPLRADGDREVMTLDATGVQIYECQAGADGQLAWAFKEPRANLTRGGQIVGKHYAGPGWELPDGSKLTARPVARADGALPTAIPQLRLEVTSNSGQGALAEVTHIQRVNTQGGVLAGPCTVAGQISEVIYTADYVMIRNR